MPRSVSRSRGGRFRLKSRRPSFCFKPRPITARRATPSTNKGKIKDVKDQENDTNQDLST